MFLEYIDDLLYGLALGTPIDCSEYHAGLIVMPISSQPIMRESFRGTFFITALPSMASSSS